MTETEQAKPDGRSCRPRVLGKKTVGFSDHGRLRTVACRFTDEQIRKINVICEIDQSSFSKAVSDLVDGALWEAEPE